MAAIGAKVSFVSSVDGNGLGIEVLNRLKDEGIDVTHVRRAASSGMGLWLAVMDQNGDLAASISQMPDLSIMEDIVREEGELIIAGCRNIVLELDLNDYISDTVLSLAKRYNKKVYGITGNMEVILRNRAMLGGLECYICNETEAGRLFEREVRAREPEQVLTLLRGYVDANGLKSMVVTLGEYGSVYYDDAASGNGFCSSIETKVTDTSKRWRRLFRGNHGGADKGLFPASGGRLRHEACFVDHKGGRAHARASAGKFVLAASALSPFGLRVNLSGRGRCPTGFQGRSR